jgi:hypothetical protein
MAAQADLHAAALAEVIDGQVVDASERVAVSIKGYANGYAATLEAIMPSWPFGVMYTVETGGQGGEPDPERAVAKITISPRVGRGIGSIITNLLLFEGGGMKVEDKRLQNNFNFAFDHQPLTERFLQHNRVADLLIDLDDHCKFSEVIIRTDAGIYMAQPKSFNSLTPELCQKTFTILGELTGILAYDF